jgi:cell division protein FtsW
MVISTTDNRLAQCVATATVLLMAIGTVFVFSAGANLSHELDLHRFYDFPGLRQILFFPIACLVMYTISRINYRWLSFADGWWKSPVGYMLVFSIALLVLVLIPQFGTEVHRARRWFRIPAGPIVVSFQPSELAKWSTLLFLAAACSHFGTNVRLYWKRFIPLCCVIGTVVGLIIVEDFGTAAFVALLSFLVLTMAGAKWWHLLTPLPLAAVGFFLALARSPGRLARLAAFLRPDSLADSTAYQANQSLIALGSGGLWGKGLGRGICKYGHLPEDTTDFVFAIIGEELGFVGTAAVIGLFIAFVCLGIVVVVRCRDPFGRLLAAGIVLAISIQAAINIGVVTVVLPTKGIPLPFVSAGGTSMLLSSAAVGVLLNVARQSARTKTDDEPTFAPTPDQPDTEDPTTV